MTMTATNQTDAVSIDFTLEEQWVVHHVVLDTIGLARKDPAPKSEDPPWRVIRILEALEDGHYSFTLFELDFLRDACRVYANGLDEASADAAIAETVIGRISRAIEHGGRQRTVPGAER